MNSAPSRSLSAPVALNKAIFGKDHTLFQSQPSLSPSPIADLRLAASKLSGPERRSFEAEMSLKYCQGNPLKAEAVFGWGRQTVALGLAEKRSGIICRGAQSAFSGRKRWEEQHAQAAQARCQLTDAHAQQDPTFRTSLTYTRLTAQSALEALRETRVIAKRSCPRRAPWPRFSIGWAIACVRW
jgi:hypothetical protein